MKRKIVLFLTCATLTISSMMNVFAAESAKAEVAVVNAPAGVAAAAERSEQWVCDFAGSTMVDTYSANGVLLNCVHVTSTATPGVVGDYTFASTAIVPGMNVKAIALSNTDGMWHEVPVAVGKGTLSVKVDAVVNPEIAFIVIK